MGGRDPLKNIKKKNPDKPRKSPLEINEFNMTIRENGTGS